MASLDDFDFQGMVRDFRQIYRSVTEADLSGIIGFALYYYYLE
jgi:hypothetical protein